MWGTSMHMAMHADGADVVLPGSLSETSLHNLALCPWNNAFAMAHQSLASAVVLPDASPSPPPQAGTKRSQQDDPEIISPKRQRTSPTPTESISRDRDNDVVPSPQVHSDRARKVSTTTTSAKPAQDETRDKRRNQRLFGALLGGPGGARPPRDSAVAKRRQEQEERRKEEAKKREAEIAIRQQERLGKLQAERRLEQRKVDRSNLRVRHANLRAMAGFLQTETDPKVYYAPWKLRPEDEDTIKRQKQDVEVLIDRELDDFADLKKKWREEDGELGHPDTKLTNGADMTNGHSGEHGPEKPEPGLVVDLAGKRADEDAPLNNSTVEQAREEAAEGQAPKSSIDVQKEQQEEQQRETDRKNSIDEGDVVVEGEEDTVIY